MPFVARDDTRRYRKVLVTGLGRSGTSAVASLLQQCGYFLGPDCDPVLMESRQMREMLLQRRDAELVSALEGWSAVHPCIAWKDPKIFVRGRAMIEALSPEWLVIVVFRDLVANAMRRVLSDGTDFMATLDHCARFQQRLAQFAAATPRSVLFVSYERLLTSPHETAAQVLQYLDPVLPVPSPEALWQTMQGQRETYRRAQAGPARAEAAAQGKVKVKSRV